MSTLTLTLDDEFVAQVEEYARRTGIDLAALFTAAIRPIITPDARHRRPTSAEVEALAGCISLPPDFDYKAAYGDYLWDKYMGRE